MKKEHYIGKEYGYYKVESFAYNKDKKNYYNCRCICGNLRQIYISSVKSGEVKSCGCMRFRKKHNKTGTKLFYTWCNMRRRCYEKTTPCYHRYGGRGIVVCEGWVKNFFLFYNWAMDNGYKEGLSIDRIDNDGDYTPLNCRWATMKEQQRNTSRTVKIVYKGIEKSLVEYAEEFNIEKYNLRDRLYRGWSVEKALTTPIRKRLKEKQKERMK